MIWNEEKVEVLEWEVGAYSISIRCKMVDGEDEWVFSGVYGPVLSWEVDDFFGELDDVKARWNLACCISGDFNLVRFSHERKGDTSRDGCMNKFGVFIERWKLIDCSLMGAKCTRSNFREHPSLN